MPLLGGADADILLLLDSCQAIPPKFPSNGSGVVSVLSATGFESGAPGVAAEVGRDSFTQALIDELGALSNRYKETGLVTLSSDIELHGNMLARLKVHLTSVEKDARGLVRADATGRVKFEVPRRRTPVYNFLSINKDPRPIFLAPILCDGDSGKRKEAATPDPAPSKTAAPPPKATAPRVPQVLISVRLGTPSFNVNAFANWILQAPEMAKDVKIEGAYGSFSTLLIIKLPSNTWDLVPKDPAMSLIGYVTSDNKASSINDSIKLCLSRPGASSIPSSSSVPGPFAFGGGKRSLGGFRIAVDQFWYCVSITRDSPLLGYDGFATANITSQCSCGDGPKTIEVQCTSCGHQKCHSCPSQTVKLPIYR